MSFLLPKLTSKKEVDQAIKSTAEKVLVLRFGRDEDPVCLQLDDIVSKQFLNCWGFLIYTFFLQHLQRACRNGGRVWDSAVRVLVCFHWDLNPCTCDCAESVPAVPPHEQLSRPHFTSEAVKGRKCYEQACVNILSQHRFHYAAVPTGGNACQRGQVTSLRHGTTELQSWDLNWFPLLQTCFLSVLLPCAPGDDLWLLNPSSHSGEEEQSRFIFVSVYYGERLTPELRLLFYCWCHCCVTIMFIMERDLPRYFYCWHHCMGGV